MSKNPRRPRIIPAGLRRCSECGLYRGENAIVPSYRYDRLEIVSVACVCGGILCKLCGGPTYRPISNVYVEETGYVLHVPWFGQAIPCRACRRRGRPRGR
jgi:hypothetical protein